jgi:hypothetical protein
MVEYIIIVVVVAIAGLVLFGIFGDTIRKKLSGAVSSLDEEKGSEAQSAAQESGSEFLKNLDYDGESGN